MPSPKMSCEDARAKARDALADPEQLARMPPATTADIADIKLRGRGRPPVQTPKHLVSLRLDQDVVAHFRATGPGGSRASTRCCGGISRRRNRQTQFHRDLPQPLVARPMCRTRRQPHGCEQVDIDIPDAAAGQRVAIDQV